MECFRVSPCCERIGTERDIVHATRNSRAYPTRSVTVSTPNRRPGSVRRIEVASADCRMTALREIRLTTADCGGSAVCGVGIGGSVAATARDRREPSPGLVVVTATDGSANKCRHVALTAGDRTVFQ